MSRPEEIYRYTGDRVHTHDWARLRRNSTVANKSAHTVTTAPSRPGDSLKPLDR